MIRIPEHYANRVSSPTGVHLNRFTKPHQTGLSPDILHPKMPPWYSEDDMQKALAEVFSGMSRVRMFVGTVPA